MEFIKRLLTVTLLLCSCLLYSQVPTNDECATAINLTPNLDVGGMCVSVSEDNTNATGWQVMPGVYAVGGCTGIDSVVFYSFVAQGVSVDIDVTSINGELPHIVLIQMPVACDFSSAVEFACVTNNTLSLDNDLIVGTTYHIMLSWQNQDAGTGVGFGAYDICVYNPMNPMNDDCDMATPIALDPVDPVCMNFNNYYPSSSFTLPPGCWGANQAEVWFSFVAQGVSIADLHVENFTGVGNAYIAILEGACNDPANFIVRGCGANGDPILLDNELVIGNTYFILVAFEDYETGTFDLCLDNPIPAFNDDCMNAPVIPPMELSQENCLTAIGADMLTNDYHSTDINTFGCWNMGDSYNVWFQFVAQGPDIDIEVLPDFAAATQIALVSFGNTPCDPNSSATIDCENGAVLSVDNQLTIGATYYIALGFEDNDFGTYCIDVFNPMPPPNDSLCSALPLDTEGGCNSLLGVACPPNQECFTTEYANPEFQANSFPGECVGSVENTVWYTITMQDPLSVGFYIDFEQVTMSGNVTIALLQNIPMMCENPNAYELLYFYCGGAPAVDDTVEFAPVYDETLTYYLMIGSDEDGEGSFNLCVEEIEPCFENNFCQDPNGGINNAEDMGLIETFLLNADCGGMTPMFTCLEGCNLYADPEPGLTACLGQTDPVVWYSFQTDVEAALLNMTIASDDFFSPSVQLFIGPDCDNLGLVGLGDNSLPCDVGTQGIVEVNGTAILGNQTYWLAISGSQTFGGNFELCLIVTSQVAACATQTSYTVTGRSLGTDLEGPFFPGETVSICLNVDDYDSSQNGCQWFQGIVPVFGAGWDVASFDADGQPMNANLGGNNYPTNGLFNGSTWNWWTSASYHHCNLLYSVGDFDGNGFLDLCHSTYDEDCPGTGLAGSTAPSNDDCWYDTDPGTFLPGGWFASGVNGSCAPSQGYPGVDWGDGNTCTGSVGGWEFCFELTVRTDCNADEDAGDLTVGFFTFADGEVGAWSGSASICANDEPLFDRLPLCCLEIATREITLDPICTGGVFSYTVDGEDIDGELVNEDVDFWQWTVDANGVIGAADGSGPNGTVVVDNLVNGTGVSQIVTYNFLGFAGGACPAIILTVNIEVLPEIEIDVESFLMCATPTNPHVITPVITGGSGTFSCQWNDPNGTSTCAITIDNPTDNTLLTLTVTDDEGCTQTATVALDVYTTFPVEIVPSSTAQCVEDGAITLDAEASGGTGIFTSYDWDTPNMGTASGISIDVSESGQYIVVVTDDQGCQGTDDIQLSFFEAPDVEITAAQEFICEGRSTQLFTLVLQDVPAQPYSFEWETPCGDSPSTASITTDCPGIHFVTVTDNNGCSSTAEFTIDAAPAPVIPLVDENVCQGDPYPFWDLDGLDFNPIVWSPNLNVPINTTSVQVPGPGTYAVTVTNEFGCRTNKTMVIGFFNVPTPSFLPDTITYCVGQGTELDAGPGWSNYDWFNVAGTNNNQETFVVTEGLYVVELMTADGCLVEDEVQVIEAEFLTPIDTGRTEICIGTSTTLGVLAEYFSYEWLTVDSIFLSNAETITTDTAGTYILFVVDDTGCNGVTNVTVTVEDPQVAITGPISICENTMDTIAATAGFASYLWSTTATTRKISVGEGTYTVTATSALGCEDIATHIVTEDGLQPTITGDTAICNGAIAVLDAGLGYVSYQWSTSPTDNMQMLGVNTEGWYYVSVTNSQGCEGIDSFFVEEFAEPTAMVTGNPDFCVGGSTILSATTGFTSYVWSTGAPALTTSMISVNMAGMYTVTVTDGNSCTTTASFIVNPPTQIPYEIGDTTSYCVGSSATLDAGDGYLTYTWGGAGSGNTQTIVVSSPGLYWVDVVTSIGCTARDSIIVQEDTELSPNILGPIAICTGDVVMLNAGAGFTTYVWGGDGSGSTQTITINSGGTYTVTVTDASGCTGEDDILVTENTTPTATVTTSTSACNTSADGSTIDFDALVTAGDMTGNWVDVDGSGVNLSNLSSVDFDGVNTGLYRFRYTTTTAVAPCMNPTYIVNITILDCDCENVQVDPAGELCNQGGMLDLNTLLQPTTVTGGTWSIGVAPNGNSPVTLTGTNVNANGSDPGSYTFIYKVTGLPMGCLDSSTTTLMVVPLANPGLLNMPAQVCATIDTTIALASLLDDEDLGGVWTETSANPSFGGAFLPLAATFRTTNQNPGLYTFEYTVGDVTGGGTCPSVAETVEVMVENLPTAEAGLTKELDCATIEVRVGGDESSSGDDFTYLWTTQNGGNITSPTESITMVDAPGIYSIRVLNIITGCFSTDDVEVVANGDFPSDILFELFTPFCESEGTATITINETVGGTGPFSYTLNDVATEGTFIDNVAPGDYVIEVTDSLGCTFSVSQINIPQANTVTVEIQVDVQTTIQLGDSLQLSYDFISNTAVPDSVVWKFNNEIICDNCTRLVWFPTENNGAVTLEAYDENGCFGIDVIEFRVIIPLIVHIPNVITPNSDNINDGFTAFVNDPTAEIEYLEIYTRWGEKIFFAGPIMPNEPALGWDGTFGGNGGEDLLPGVYVYNLKIRYPDRPALDEVIKGDVTLLR